MFLGGTAPNNLEEKLMEMDQKLRIITKSYMKLKEMLKDKDEQIASLKSQNQRILQAQNQKQNAQLIELRRKYEMEKSSKVNESRESKIVNLNNIDPSLRIAKSLSPSLSHKNEFLPSIPKVEMALKSTQRIIGKQERIVTQPRKEVLKISSPKAQLTFLEELEKQPSKKLAASRSQQNFRRELNRQQTQTMILQELWEQRDREIKRMDDLFENLNKRIGKPL